MIRIDFLQHVQETGFRSETGFSVDLNSLLEDQNRRIFRNVESFRGHLILFYIYLAECYWDFQFLA